MSTGQIRVEEEPASGSYVARCYAHGCGFAGPWRSTRSEADDDALAHRHGEHQGEEAE